MSAIPTETALSMPASVLDPQHEHTSHCYWDLYECRWHCARSAVPDDPPDSSAPFTG